MKEKIQIYKIEDKKGRKVTKTCENVKNKQGNITLKTSCQ